MKKEFLQGMIKRHPDGFGFFIPDQSEHPDVYIPRNSMKGVMTNDRVMIDVFPERGGQRFRGEILKIVSRGTKSLVGTFQPMNAKTGLIRDEGKGWGEDLKIPLDESMGAKAGELVSAEIITFPDHPDGFRGRVTEVIGNALDPLTDIKRVLLQNHVPHEFHPDVEKEARTFSHNVSDKDMHGRKNLRNLNFITIDGATAKDFDDAVLVENNGRGFRLFVAIADVSHYVKIGRAIDREAFERGTSVYFPNFVVPMLPEVLSNGLCSLNPHVPRLALVAEMQMDFTGQVVDSNFYEAVIESKARVTYGEAQEIIDGNEVEKIRHVKSEILLAADLAKILMAKRFKEGSLDLEIPETEIVIDSSGMPIDFIRSERLFAHRLIEEMMLAANVAVAKFLSSQEIPAVYRIHEPPNEDAIAMLEKYLMNFGSRVKISDGKLQKRLTRALQEFEGRPEAQILNILTLRSMSQAKYSADNLGHFGLGFEYYTHFTSPIRRYPDLIVHRLLKSQIMTHSEYKLMPEEDLQTAATMLSACEQRSVKAERQFQSIKKARFMQKFIGEEFEGIISSVTKFGVFVLLRQFEVDGLVRSENLSKEKLEFDEDNLVLFGKRSGIQFAIGDLIKVRVDAADPEAGQIDFGVAGSRPSAAGKGKSRQERPSRGRQENKPHREPIKEHRKSRKAQAMDQIEDKVFQFLTEANTETESRGEKFDPEKHLQKVLKKWKERNVDLAPPPRRGQSSFKSGHSQSGEEREDRNESEEKRSKPAQGKSFFKKFRSKDRGSNKKSSAQRGKRK
ncbi:MAG: ribonuclease R [Pseudobdellovibrionaceae bacterium]